MPGGTVVVLGIGLQGRAALEDLERSPSVSRVIAADLEAAPIEQYLRSVGGTKTTVREFDANIDGQLRSLISEPGAVVISFLPSALATTVARAAIETGANLVTTNYGHNIRSLDGVARDRSITIMPEAGFDPGIDLVLAKRIVDEFDETEVLNSYASGVPAPECRNANVISYKISWDFTGVLDAYRRPARFLRDGTEWRLEGSEIFRPQWIHHVEVERLGSFEAFLNGDAVAFADLLGIRGTIRETGRFTLRWPGHCAFWNRISRLGLLDDRPAKGGVSPREYLVRHLTPRLQYEATERDIVFLRVDAVGTRAGLRLGRRFELIGYRDLESGLLAMNRLVGYPASITAQMILAREITRRGVGSPARDIPPAPFLDALAARGIEIIESQIEPSTCSVTFGRNEKLGREDTRSWHYSADSR